MFKVSLLIQFTSNTQTLKVPSILLASTSYCGLCSIDAMAACVVNIGGGIVHTVPYYEGLLIAHAIQRLDVAGQGKLDLRKAKQL